MPAPNITAKIVRLEQELKQALAHEALIGELLEKKLNELYIHYHISRTISSIPDLRTMLAMVTGIIKKSIPFERISVYLLHETGSFLTLAYSDGIKGPLPERLLIGQGAPGRITENGEHVHIHDLAVYYETFNDFIHWPGEEQRGGSYIGIALKAYDKTIGVIGMDSPTRHGLSVDDMDFMAILSHLLAAGIEKNRLFETIQHLSQHDGLTGLYNYRIFKERLQQEILKQNRTHKPLSLIMLDIDDFKKFNDAFGHQAGDEALKELAGIMRHQSRSSSLDICCRYGGEEFALIMPELALQGALLVAERIRKAAVEHTFVLKGRGTTASISVSIGVAELSGQGDLALEALVKKADDALYLSKRAGKNRVTTIPHVELPSSQINP